ncbi:uncharacterized protein H6S33_004197 [Morchella sextelata]|uniref:uncharacterized protein n=1 Tax=Morchella sextelata TaxID=1174677 RepID=UPI001D041FF8|nr:uncharacterized protein H6S33_004197 [Morchella sextelata]KAH0605740.1 hypothetical protein H6S33_004197 [Morchella sextelata]
MTSLVKLMELTLRRRSILSHSAEFVRFSPGNQFQKKMKKEMFSPFSTNDSPQGLFGIPISSLARKRSLVSIFCVATSRVFFGARDTPVGRSKTMNSKNDARIPRFGDAIRRRHSFFGETCSIDKNASRSPNGKRDE